MDVLQRQCTLPPPPHFPLTVGMSIVLLLSFIFTLSLLFEVSGRYLASKSCLYFTRHVRHVNLCWYICLQEEPGEILSVRHVSAVLEIYLFIYLFILR